MKISDNTQWNLNELIGNSLLRQDWKKDAWNREYKFTIIDNGNGFLTSAGSAGKFGTEDDINWNKILK
ncbi:hypothetical protein QO206_06500 [Leeuwenhoekiella aequorea]|uniref:hypothetical protein n=1 Tax=Leeuwenhoekiella aequorea TaxID=283736 RepID=UPI00352F86B4